MIVLILSNAQNAIQFLNNAVCVRLVFSYYKMPQVKNKNASEYVIKQKDYIPKVINAYIVKQTSIIILLNKHAINA